MMGHILELIARLETRTEHCPDCKEAARELDRMRREILTLRARVVPPYKINRCEAR